MAKSKIEWTDATWNPVRGCVKISPGCKNCYAETFAERWRGVPGHPYEQGFDLKLVPHKLEEPLSWRQPKRVFVNSMSDLFQEGVPMSYVMQVFAVMALAKQHAFQILTKRPERMLEMLTAPGVERWLNDSTMKILDERGDKDIRSISYDHPRWPLPNVWLGVSVENQEYADKRIPLLLQTPAAIRFVSYEPALGPINFREFAAFNHRHDWLTGKQRIHPSLESTIGTRLDWIIVGGESGTGARLFHVQWARNVVKQCKAAKVPVFVKQMGGNAQERNDKIADVWFYADGSDMQTEALDADSYKYQGAPVRLKLKDRKGGDPQEWPEDLRVREFPGKEVQA